MTTPIENREKMIEALREELVGPSPQGEPIDCFSSLHFKNDVEAFKPHYQKDSGEEILKQDRPCNRYSVGVLYPIGKASEKNNNTEDPNIFSPELFEKTDVSDIGESDVNETDESVEDSRSAEWSKHLEKIEEREDNIDDNFEPERFEFTSANRFKPSSMGISFLAEIPKGAKLQIEVSGGRYQKKDIHLEEKPDERTWWLRSPIKLIGECSGEELLSGTLKIPVVQTLSENLDGMNLCVEVLSRPQTNKNSSLLTVYLVNRKESSTTNDFYCLFQSFFKVTVVSPQGNSNILPYPKPFSETQDEEEQSLALLYRRFETYAVGHGCAANWILSREQEKAISVQAECLPVVETPSITPDITREDGTPVEISMFSLSSLEPKDNGFAALEELITLYENWITKKRQEINFLPEHYQSTATNHLNLCTVVANRMKAGLSYLKEDKKAQKAFQLTNYAILLQQIRSILPNRQAEYDSKNTRISFSENYIEPNISDVPKGRGFWRAFQIAFLLTTISSTSKEEDPDRKTVELIWFPTGGGKTEAYLGLTAFTLFMGRLKNPEDIGVKVLMRYTLRLLTTQQFQRASTLISAMEYLRKKNEKELGTKEFSIGIWVGGQTTPNSREEAIKNLNSLSNPGKFQVNNFLLNRCPWCNAQMGLIEQKFKSREKKHNRPPLGYERIRNTVLFKCPDTKCFFKNRLPIYVIDEDIYEQRPSLVIGTVDKFAMLAFRPEARSLFGIGKNGDRQFSPPSLIIQDELHLISGPLGSMVGLYEVVIEEFCTDRRDGKNIPPKIISSTATIRRYTEQICSLYGRESVCLFPPSGLEIADSFFAQYAQNKDGSFKPGRKYVGVAVPDKPYIIAQIRSIAALLQAPNNFDVEGRDPWWTILIFFNSLRLLGSSLSMFQSSIPDYLRVIRNRKKIANLRKLYRIMELTSRLGSDELPKTISLLETSYSSSKSNTNVVDVCLASNIIEVGIDIERLSLMVVVGQPKTTSQYIQVTGRIGRKWWERPGLVTTIYNAFNPRDRSHFEKFRSYHERLYSRVEPTSVTPFSPPVLERALSAIMVTYVQQMGDQKTVESPYPYPHELLEQLRKILLPRIKQIDPEEISNFEKVFQNRVNEWKAWQRTKWSGQVKSDEIPFLREAGAYAPNSQRDISWAIPLSMRNVDRECRAKITTEYLKLKREEGFNG